MSNVNKIRKYKVVVRNISPLKIGNGEDEGFQLLLQGNQACISGTIMAGLFRAFLLNNKGLEQCSDIYKMGYPDSKETSTIFFYDSLSNEEIKENDIECRPHIRIDEKTETAVQGGLFSECHISEGKTFEIEFEVRALEISEEKYNVLCEYLEEFLYLLGNGNISIGSKSTFGFGIVKFSGEESCCFKEFDLTNEQDLDEYLNDSSKYNKVKFKEYKKEVDTTITLKAYCKDGLIIKGEKEKINIDGRNCYKNVSYKEINTENEQGEKEYMYVIPASTIKGIVHSYCKKIILTLGKNVEILDDIFGEKTNEREKKEGRRGNLIFNDYKISEDRLKKCKSTYNRIKIDRFTGGAFQGNIFRDEVIIFNKNTHELEFKVSISNKLKSIDYDNQKLFEKAIALIILTFRDMGLGYVTVGSGNNVGLGRLQGNSIIIKDNCNEYKVQFKNGELVSYDNRHSDVKKFQEYIKALNE